MQYKEFIFEAYSYDPAVSTLSLRYRFGGGPRFEEKLIFNFVPQQLSSEASAVLDRIFRLIFLMSGVSYYKSFVPPTLISESFPVDRVTAGFLHKFYEKGLAEFAFRNRISLHDHFVIRASGDPPPGPIAVDLPRCTCVPVGGGKDSIVTLECLKGGGEPLILFSLGDAEPIRACIAAAGLPFIRVQRRLDCRLFKVNEAVPTSTINTANPWSLKRTSLSIYKTTYRLASRTFPCCDRCRKFRSPAGSLNIANIIEFSAAAMQFSGNRPPLVRTDGAVTVRNAGSCSSHLPRSWIRQS